MKVYAWFLLKHWNDRNSSPNSSVHLAGPIYFCDQRTDRKKLLWQMRSNQGQRAVRMKGGKFNSIITTTLLYLPGAGGGSKCQQIMFSVLGCMDLIESVLIEQAIDRNHLNHTGTQNQRPTRESVLDQLINPNCYFGWSIGPRVVSQSWACFMVSQALGTVWLVTCQKVTHHPGLSRVEGFPRIQTFSANTGLVPSKLGWVAHAVPNKKHGEPAHSLGAICALH